MKTKNCPTCKEEMRFIPEGISKAGKKYNAFWGCTKECDTTVPIPEKEGHYMSMMTLMVKDKSIAFFNSINSAIEMQKGFLSFFKGFNREKYQKDRDTNYKEWEEWYIKNVINEE